MKALDEYFLVVVFDTVAEQSPCRTKLYHSSLAATHIKGIRYDHYIETTISK